MSHPNHPPNTWNAFEEPEVVMNNHHSDDLGFLGVDLDNHFHHNDRTFRHQNSLDQSGFMSEHSTHDHVPSISDVVISDDFCKSLDSPVFSANPERCSRFDMISYGDTTSQFCGETRMYGRGDILLQSHRVRYPHLPK